MSGSCFLFDEPHRCCPPRAAIVLGEGPATLLQTLHWRLEKSTHQLGGCTWVYDTYDAWQRDWFPHWSLRTVKRHFATLKAKGIVIIRHDLNAHAYDTTSWFSIDRDKLAEIEALQGLLSQRSATMAQPENHGHRPKGQSGTSPDWPTCQNDTDETLRFQPQETPPGEDVSHTPDVVCPPAAAALAVVAPLQQAAESAEEGESPAPSATVDSAAVPDEASAKPLAAPREALVAWGKASPEVEAQRQEMGDQLALAIVPLLAAAMMGHYQRQTQLSKERRL